MKYYVYISDAKVDMLISQIPHEAKKKIASELGIDVKIFRATRKVESEPEDDRISRLDAVVKYIRDWGNLGTVQQPDVYIEDTMDMRFQILALDDRTRQSDESANSVAYWTGKEVDTLLGLGGSPAHLIGADKNSPPNQHGKSFAFQIIGALRMNVAEEESNPTEDAGSTATTVFRSHRYLEMRLGSFPLERFSFMAKRMTKGSFGDSKTILGSPLYVAKED